jgi:hypothetical protein
VLVGGLDGGEEYEGGDLIFLLAPWEETTAVELTRRSRGSGGD